MTLRCVTANQGLPSLQKRAAQTFDKEQQLAALYAEQDQVKDRLAQQTAPVTPAAATRPTETGAARAARKGIELPPVTPVNPAFMTDEVRDIIERSTIEGGALTLPEELPRKVYERVNRAIESAGGRWDKSSKTHLFAADPSVALGLAEAPGRRVTE